MKFGSVCSGIEAASVAFGPALGWEAQWFSEIEPFPCAVLKHRYPGVPNLGDMTKIYDKTEFRTRKIDVLCGGTPCQSFSVAGLRKGLDDPRGNLALEFLRIAEVKRPRWILWENVPGVLSSGGGRDFGSFLGALGQLGYGWAYRVLDAEFFGVPQRRRRVFVVAYLGDWRPASAVLFESESLCRYDSARRKAGKEVAGVAGGGAKDSVAEAAVAGVPYRKVHRAASTTDAETWEETAIANTPNAFDTGERDTHAILVPKYAGDNPDVVNTVSSKWAKQSGGPVGDENSILVLQPRPQGVDLFNLTLTGDLHCPLRTAGGHGAPSVMVPKSPVVYENHGQDSRLKEVSVCPQLNAKAGTGGNNLPLVVAVDCYNQTIHPATTQTLSSAASDINHTGGIIYNMEVRRITPTEAERLQGFPDGYTNLTDYKKGRECPDGPRYKALGNSWAVPCARWIGRRIEKVEQILNEQALGDLL